MSGNRLLSPDILLWYNRFGCGISQYHKDNEIHKKCILHKNIFPVGPFRQYSHIFSDPIWQTGCLWIHFGVKDSSRNLMLLLLCFQLSSTLGSSWPRHPVSYLQVYDAPAWQPASDKHTMSDRSNFLLTQLSQIGIEIGGFGSASGVSFHHKTCHLAGSCISLAAAVSANSS